MSEAQTPTQAPAKKSILDWIKLALGVVTVLAGAGVIKGKVGDTINKAAPVVGPIVNSL